MVQNLLQQHFPMIPTRVDVLKSIHESPALHATFMEWNEEQQKEFLDFCTGERGVKVLYDSFFKEILNPETTPERLEKLLSLIMKQPVKILQVLPNDSTRLADETSLFHQFPEEYLHYFTQKSDTGLELNLLQEYYFVPLDIFRKNIQNKGIKTKLDAWLTFLTSDEPEMILELICSFPEFKPLYEDIYELCRNVEGVMNMFSKELRELDKNTVQYMIDVMQEEIDTSKKMLSEQSQQLSEQEQLLKQQALETQLYIKLNADGRHAELGRAFTDTAFRMQLLTEYGLQK